LREELKCMIYKNHLNQWEYGEEFLNWLQNNASNFSGLLPLTKYMDMNLDTIRRIIDNNNLTMSYNPQLNKHSPEYKALYQNYDWCYEKFMVEGLNHDEMAKEANASKRVIKKWITEIHRITPEYRQKTTKFTKQQHDLLIGSLLGDGHIDKRETQPVFIVSHANNQKDYLFYKYDILQSLCNKEPSFINSSTKKFGDKEYAVQSAYRICTRIYDEFKVYRSMSKRELINELNEFSLSILVLDDGFRGKSYWNICLAEYSQEDIEFTLAVLKDKFGLNARQSNHDKRYINTTSDSSRKLDEIILKNIPNNLDIIKYKIIENNNICDEQVRLMISYKNEMYLLTDFASKFNMPYNFVWDKYNNKYCAEEIIHMYHGGKNEKLYSASFT